MTVKPNLPVKRIKKAIISVDVTPRMKASLENFGVDFYTVEGLLQCDASVKNHPDIYFAHICQSTILTSKNICSIQREHKECFENMNVVSTEISECFRKPYMREVLFNCVSIGNYLICNPKLIHPFVLDFSLKQGKKVISVKQGYTKCNICVVDENSVITEDEGIYKELNRYGFDILLLESKSVLLPGHKYGFIGGASGKISQSELVFFGNIEKHPEFYKIFHFLDERGIVPISLSDESLTDYGSMIPIEE